MNLTIEFKKPEISGAFEWQLCQEINVKNEKNEVIAKAEIELITINKHRDALGSYSLLADEHTDWEIPLNLYFKGQNLTKDLCDQLDIIPDSKKAKTHILIEAISVLPEFRKQAVGQFLLKEIDDLPTGGVILALGSIAHTTILRSLQLPVKNYPFSHTGVFPLHSDLQLLSSYHCSRYNTQTKRLTTPMFEKVFEIARNLLNHA